MKPFCFLTLMLLSPHLSAQIDRYPYTESFDTVTVPSLPSGWSSTTNRSTSGDFTTTTSAPYSGPSAVVSSNAAVEQALVSPPFDFSLAAPDSLVFYERRSSSHNSGLIIEASTDAGSTFGIIVSDTLQNPGFTGYVIRAISLPSLLYQMKSVFLRWHILGNGTGTTGTIRFDDVKLTVRQPADLTIRALSFQPGPPQSGDRGIISATIKNVGIQTIPRFTTSYYLDANKNSIADTTELISGNESDQRLASNDSLIVSAQLPALPSGISKVVAVVDAPADSNHSNDTLSISISTGYLIHSAVINEIMYEPTTGNAEYVEIFNPSGNSVDVQNWKLSDRKDTTALPDAYTISKSSELIDPGQFLVVASDSSIYGQFRYLNGADMHVIIRKSGLSLNNSGDRLILSDYLNSTIDSLYYFPQWNNPSLEDVTGKSLERINPLLPSTDEQNWTTSASPEGGTPGKINSVYTKLAAHSTTLSVSPNPFSPDGDGFEDITMISYHLPIIAGVVRMRIFDNIGRLVRILADGQPTGSSGTIIWNGLNDRNNRVRIGIYIIYLEAYDSTDKQVVNAKGVVVVGIKL